MLFKSILSYLIVLLTIDTFGQYSISEITNSMVKLKVLTTNELVVDEAGIIEKKYEWGGGFYISDDGLILTANHIINNASEEDNNPITCFEPTTLESDGVWIVFQDEDNDIAVLQNEKYTGAEKKSDFIDIFGNASNLTVGLECFAIGFPNELLVYKSSFAIALGRITSLESNIEGSNRIPWRKKLLVATCEVNSGFSGGLLIDTKMYPIGIIIGMIEENNKDIFTLVKRIRDLRKILRDNGITNK